jgi:uncharacterized protein YuzE
MPSNRTSIITYEPEADVLSYEVSKAPIDAAFEMGNVIIHVNKKNTPVLIEILEASKFLNSANKVLINKTKSLHRSLIMR